MGKLTLYGLDASPPVRACKLTLSALNIPYEFMQVNVLSNENLSKEYLEKNPQHTVPTLEDDGNFIWDSHAIMAYLASKYGKDDSLYPKDLLKRAVVDQRLHFESGVVFHGGLRNITVPLFFQNESNIPQHKIDAVRQVYDFLEKFLEKHPYVAGDKLTIADFSLISTVTSLFIFDQLNVVKYPKLTAWWKRMEQLPYYEQSNGKGLKIFYDMAASKNFTIGS